MPAATHADPGFIALEGGDSRVEVVPGHGGRIRSLHLFGREWLLPGGAAQEPQSGRAAIAGAGWDECAPSAAGGTVPDWVKGVGGHKLTVGGDARLQVPDTALITDDEGHKVRCTWRGGERMPWVLTRTLLVRPDGAVESRYEALTTGAQRLPFLWSAWLLMPLSAETRLQLPEGGRFRVAAVTGADRPREASTAEGRWPTVVLDNRARDLTTPWAVPKRTQLAAWLDLGSGRSRLQLSQADARLTISFDGAGVPYCGLVLDREGTHHRGGKGQVYDRDGAACLALVPSLGAPDSYTQALGEWQSITWLVPGEPRRWTVTIRGGTV